METPFGAGYRQEEAKELRTLRFDSVMLNKKLPGRHDFPIEVRGETAGGWRLFKNQEEEQLAAPGSDTSYRVECRLLSAAYLLCRVTQEFEYPEPGADLSRHGVQRRVEYYGFKKSISPEVAAMLNETLAPVVEQLKGYGKENR